MHKHDKGYKLLYTNRYMLKHLMRIALGAENHALFDWSTIKQVKNELIDVRKLVKRQSDIVWSVTRNDGVKVYALIFLEHQSDIERLMPLRYSNYVGLSLDEILRDPKLNSTSLPMILPIVIYNGLQPWNAPVKVSQLLAEVPDELRNFQPQFEYMLLDLNELIADNKLPDDNLAAIQLKMDAGCSYDEFTQLLDKFIALTEHPKYQAVRDIFNAWLKHVILPRNVLSKGFEAIDTENIMQTSKLLYESKPTWSEEFQIKGREEGRKEGLEQGKADMLLRLLKHKFTDVPDHVEQKIKSATIDYIDKWFLKALDAKTINEVFDIELNGH